MKRSTGFAIAAIALAGCASSAGGSSFTPSPSARGADVQFEVQAYIDSVYRFCVPSVESGLPYEQLEISNSGQFRPMTPGANSLLGTGTVGMYRTESGVVQIDNSKPDWCRVVAYGLPVEATQSIVALTLQQENMSFSEEVLPESSPSSSFMRIFTKQDDSQRKISVILSGSKPGSPGTISRFSTLSATVSAVDPKDPT